MFIHGLQKMTLLDFPGRVACTVFLGGCDYRCPFCHNFELIDGTAKPIMDDAELLSFLKKRQGLLDGVAITGGEPCLHKDLPELLRNTRALGFATKLDSNGAHPDMLKSLLDEGLVDYVAMDIKNSPGKYAQTCGVSYVDLAPIYESISLLKNSNIDYEFRTTVVAQFHELSDFEEIGQMISGAKHYFLQCFTDRDSVPFGNLSAPSVEDLQSYAETARKYVPDTQLRGVS
ncbi:MAG: anaerobic ribonucleoside-triphosphate reductase activating protein [Lachnospiraceae bacterium]|nr:anaerobic ribonucleoside-triphosphate reductase activating protein [Lachnospiraceae bacterium]